MYEWRADYQTHNTETTFVMVVPLSIKRGNSINGQADQLTLLVLAFGKLNGLQLNNTERMK